MSDAGSPRVRWPVRGVSVLGFLHVTAGSAHAPHSGHRCCCRDTTSHAADNCRVQLSRHKTYYDRAGNGIDHSCNEPHTETFPRGFRCSVSRILRSFLAWILGRQLQQFAGVATSHL